MADYIRTLTDLWYNNRFTIIINLYAVTIVTWLIIPEILQIYGIIVCMEMMTIIHPWNAVYDEYSEVLILGTIPSPKSREMGFYYGHPQNIFWKTLAKILNQPEPSSNISNRKDFLLRNHIAVWDVLHSCEIEGASDSSIRNPIANKFKPLLKTTQITKIFTTGKKGTELFEKYCVEESGMCPIYLPSTSPANRGQQAKPEFMKLWEQVAEVLA
jgi:hypoxanthine-DNA glycosylase